MNIGPIEVALHEMAAFLESQRAPYMLIGGLAAVTWGVPRLTRDVDLSVQVEPEMLEDFARRVITAFKPRISGALELASERRVLLVSASNGTPVDMIFALLPYEEVAIERAKKVSIGGRHVRVISPEDLILHKIVEPRAIDEEDIRRVISEQRNNLDRKYLDPRVRELSALMGDPAIDGLYREAWAAVAD